MWLGDVLTELGCQAVPALHCRQALVLATRLKLPIATLVINPELRGARRMVRALMAANPGLRVVLIRDSAARGNGGAANQFGIQARSTLERPSPWESISRLEWIARVRKTLV